MATNMMNADPIGNPADASRTGAESPRSLTYDEKKAAEAAFRGEPFNPAWSAAAARVYEGILMAKGARALDTLVDATIDSECVMS
jgi:hypothetical protein